MVKVAVFTDNDFAKVNGVTTTLSAVLKYAPSDIHIRVYTAADLQADDPQYLALKSIGVPIPFYGEMLMYLPRVQAYIKRAIGDGIDVVHLTTPGPIGLASMRVARVLDLPLIGSFHTDLAAYTSVLSGSAALGGLMERFMRWPYGRCVRVLVPSHATKKMLTTTEDRDDRFVVWSRGVDAVLFSPAKRSARTRDDWHVSPRRPAIMYVGRVSREKGLDLLPAIQAELYRRKLSHRFIIVGQGPMLSELQTRLHDALFTGSLSRRDVASAFASADLFIFPSRTDTAGNVVLEAQASGLPVVVSDAGGPHENMVDHVTGTVVRSREAAAWVDALEPILRNDHVRGELAQGAREYALSRRWEAALEPLYQAYRDAAEMRSSVKRTGMGDAVTVAIEPQTVGGVLPWIGRHPWEAVGRRWNYKSALLSASTRSLLFFATNLSAGAAAAIAALTTEFWFRLMTAGFYGALTQAFRRAEPRGTATLCVLILLPLLAHSLELLVHWWRGTAELAASIGSSIAFTALSTSFNLFAMRHGALIIGEHGRSILDDLRAMPRLMTVFVASAVRTCVRSCL